MGELRTLRRLIFGEWKYQHTHDFDVYPFSEYWMCHRYFDCPRSCRNGPLRHHGMLCFWFYVYSKLVWREVRDVSRFTLRDMHFTFLDLIRFRYLLPLLPTLLLYPFPVSFRVTSRNIVSFVQLCALSHRSGLRVVHCICHQQMPGLGIVTAE